MRSGPIFVLLITLILLLACSSGVDEGDSESQEIADFLEDEHINAVLSEEWDIFDEWAYARSVGDFNKLYQWRSALAYRAGQNYRDLLQISPPGSLQEFWGKITEATKGFREGATGVRVRGQFADQMTGWAVEKNALAWVALKNICKEHNIPFPWGLPRSAPRIDTEDWLNGL